MDMKFSSQTTNMGELVENERHTPAMGLSGSTILFGGNDSERFYGVHIPNSSEGDFLHVYEDKVEALKVVKHHKKARFKAFKLRSDAVAFAVHGSETSVSEESTSSANSTSQSDAEKPSPFKGPKSQDMVQLRRAIESGNIELVSKTVWDNPRFLISSGDTPSILQEGSRYNALHVAAKSKNAAMADLILQTVGNPSFLQLLYGDETTSCSTLSSAAERSTILLDLYLNTPDKGMHETPLHFASKFGAVQVVSTLVSYSQCDRESKNKFGLRPIDIVCSRCPNSCEDLKFEITSLLQNDYYVPVLRAQDNTLQPIILNEDPLSPRLEIHAFAGPMSESEATEFHRLWRTPQRAKGNPSRAANEPRSCPSTFRLSDPQKGLERVGRDLAADRSVPWKEYWPFLNTFTDLTSNEGLSLLEEYLAKRYQIAQNVFPDCGDNYSKLSSSPENSIHVIGENRSLDETDTEPEVLSPVTQLCSLMNACTILDDSVGSGLGRGSPTSSSCSPSPSPPTSNGSILSSSARFFDWLSRKRPETDKKAAENSQNEALLTALSNPTVSPFLYVEKSLQLFAKRIAASLHHIVTGNSSHRLSDSIRDVLKPEVKRVQSLVSSYMEDARFVAVDYHLVHSRIASSVAERLVGQLTWEEREVFYNSLQDMLAAKGNLDGTLSSDDDDAVPSSTPYRQPRTSRQSNTSNQKTAIRCIVCQMVWALDQLQGSGPDGRSPLPPRPQVRTESECLEMWSDAYLCLCSWPAHNQSNFSRGCRKSSSFKRPMNSSQSSDYQNVSRQLEYDTKTDTDAAPKHNSAGTPSSGCEEDFDTFYTPPSSLRGSPVPQEDSESDEEEMNDAEEGPVVFIEGNKPSHLDADVVNAISLCNINQVLYPHVYRWRHDILLYPLEERKKISLIEFFAENIQPHDHSCSLSKGRASSHTILVSNHWIILSSCKQKLQKGIIVTEMEISINHFMRRVALRMSGFLAMTT
ncbi:Ankyrin repeat and LEM domain-containing protein 2 [Frankliniella fusca]|uniref:Ankyrin repeat and LEM domain-containing protein 2 n=1 Tax=Frankliniella fusca TaxID=407009 RepID=A0AAE1I4H2_9NEOP|nr:Ankyrin repeat and LEM domain-containing protein 2 [Frankliniella fusca]